MDETAHSDSPRTTPVTAPVDWLNWSPMDRATLVFVVDAGHVLLIRKKRGLGSGKINGPGGKIELGESPLDGARREVEEELRVTPTGLRQSGVLNFQFVDGYSIHVTVFRADGCIGVAEETPEAAPIWTPIEQIPYDEMWADDRLWIPRMLAGETFKGRFLFDGDVMLEGEIE